MTQPGESAASEPDLPRADDIALELASQEQLDQLARESETGNFVPLAEDAPDPDG